MKHVPYVPSYHVCSMRRVRPMLAVFAVGYPFAGYVA